MPGFEFFNDQERKEVNDVLETGILMRYGFDAARKNIWKAKTLEQEISKTFGVQHTQLCSSGTAALVTALSALKIGYGDEVIMPTFTFVATFEAIISVGAIPVLVDIDKSLTLDTTKIEKAITPKTKAIMVVHMCGSMANMDNLINIGKKHNIFIIEDACQSIGGKYKDKYLGSIGDIGSFSFDFVKTITCGEGGAVLTNNNALYTYADAFTDHGHDHLGIDRGADLHPFMGLNFRISELQAAVGLAQLKKLPQFLTIQKKHHNIIKSYLAQISQISFRHIPDPNGDSCTFLSWFAPSAEIANAIINEFKEQKIAAGQFYWYNNNWHYIRKWDHLKQLTNLSALSPESIEKIKINTNKNFADSDAIMSCCISTLINLGWTEEDTHKKGQQMKDAIQKVLSR